MIHLPLFKLFIAFLQEAERTTQYCMNPPRNEAKRKSTYHVPLHNSFEIIGALFIRSQMPNLTIVLLKTLSMVIPTNGWETAMPNLKRCNKKARKINHVIFVHRINIYCCISFGLASVKPGKVRLWINPGYAMVMPASVKLWPALVIPKLRFSRNATIFSSQKSGDS